MIRFQGAAIFKDAWDEGREWWDVDPIRGSEDDPAFRKVDRPDENEPEDHDG